MSIYYLGPAGSFSHSLVKKIFHEQDCVPSESFNKIVQEVVSNQSAIGVLGLENSISSSVHGNIDHVYNNDLCIIGEASMNIHLHLIGKGNVSLDQIKTVVSHPQALAQCAQFIEQNQFKTQNAESTAAAVSIVRENENPTIAAIGGKNLAVDSSSIIKEDVGNQSTNMTRWVFVSQNGKPMGENINKVTYIFQVKHEPGSLVKVLQAIADKEGNLSKIESRPVPGTNWEYEFWVDIEIPEGDLVTFEKIMKEETLRYRRVGAYEKGKLYEE